MAVPEVPYDDEWSLVGYPLRGKEYNWRPNRPFEAIFVLDGFARGMSSATFRWKLAGTGRTFNMFMKDMEILLHNGTVSNGVTELRFWIVRKRGNNYGIGLASEEEAFHARNQVDNRPPSR